MVSIVKKWFYDLALRDKGLFIVGFVVLLCLVVTPINFKIIEPIEKSLNIPSAYVVHDRECTGFGVSGLFYSCEELETTHLENSRISTYFIMYTLEVLIFIIIGYGLNLLIIKKKF